MKNILWCLLLVSVLTHAQDEASGARALFESGAYEKALPLLQKASEQNPKNLANLEMLGDCHSHLTHWEAAAAVYHKLALGQPTFANYQYKFGGATAMVAQTANKFKALSLLPDIRNAFERTIFLDSKNMEARWALVEYYLQVPGILGGSVSKAKQYARQLEKLSAVDGYLALGRIAEYESQFTAAESWYKKAIAAGKSKTTYEKLVNLYQYKFKDPDKARQIWNEYLQSRS